MTRARIAAVRAACEQLLADGNDVTFTAVAEHSGISRATCYRDRDLRAVIEAYRSRHGQMLTLTGLADRIDNVTQALEAVADKVRRQEEELRALRQSSGPTPPRAARQSPPPAAD
jgi:predicted DNA-binding transcriptional regulator YafY